MKKKGNTKTKIKESKSVKESCKKREENPEITKEFCKMKAILKKQENLKKQKLKNAKKMKESCKKEYLK